MNYFNEMEKHLIIQLKNMKRIFNIYLCFEILPLRKKCNINIIILNNTFLILKVRNVLILQLLIENLF